MQSCLQMQMVNVKMFKTIPMFILVFTGYLCNNMGVATDIPASAQDSPTSHKVMEIPQPTSHKVMETPQPTSHKVMRTPKPTPHKVTQVPQSEAPPSQSSDVPVAAIVVPSVLLPVAAITVGWFAWKKSKSSSLIKKPSWYHRLQKLVKYKIMLVLGDYSSVVGPSVQKIKFYSVKFESPKCRQLLKLEISEEAIESAVKTTFR
ncbi:uncharacterized protein LJ264_004548 [Porphyrio hochstetteri]